MSPAAQKKADEFLALSQTLQDVLGVVLGENRRNLIAEKLAPVMAANKFNSYDVLASAMADEEAGDLRLSVMQAITEHSSQWFGYSEIESLMRDYVLPDAINQNKVDFKVWLVGCAQGQIAYSLAMTIDAFRNQYGMSCNVEVVATDLSEEIVKKATKGKYPIAELSGLSETDKKLYMKEKDGLWQVSQSLRSMIHFKTCNLLGGLESMGSFDLIICPDELIYFSNEVKNQILDEFASVLDPSGMLIVGSNEAVIPYCKKFEMVNHEAGVFYRQLPDA